MSDQSEQLTTSAKDFAEKATDFFAKHRFTIVFIIASSVVLLALVQSRSYLNPVRNEARYEEGKLKINYATIDQDIVEELSNTLNDKNIEVSPSLVPGRNNPFAE